MITFGARGLSLLILSFATVAQARHVATQPFTAAATNLAVKAPITSASKPGSAVLRAQILLDRAHFSPGEIDGRFGGNTRLAVADLKCTRWRA